MSLSGLNHLFKKDQLDQLLMGLAEDSDVPESVRDYAVPEFQRGVEYHSRYIARLGMLGATALDAGCGVGNWSLALSDYFDSVTALEFSKDRLEFTSKVSKASNIRLNLVQGSIEELPFPDKYFDCVFCNGVIFLTDYKKSMSEFSRVLKPGGMIYITFNEQAWWNHLIVDRGELEPHLLAMSCEMLENQVANILESFSTASKYGKTIVGKLLMVGAAYVGMQRAYDINFSIKKQIKLHWTLKKVIWYMLRNCKITFNDLRALLSQANAIKIQLKLISNASQIIFSYGTRAQHANLGRDLLRFVREECIITVPRRGYSIDRSEMQYLAESNCLDIVGVASEGLLMVNADYPIEKTIIPQNWGVAEILLHKPTESSLWLSPQNCKENAKLSSLRYSGITHKSVISNYCDSSSIGFYLWQYFRHTAFSLSSNEILLKLVDKISSMHDSDEERVIAITKFVQDSVFHHPVVQLIDENGGIEKVGVTEILMSGIGRCGHAAKVIYEILGVAGFNVKLTQLYKHICCEVFMGGRWCVIDADAFKAGVMIRNDRGQLATLEELRANSILIDGIPAIGQQIAKTAKWSLGAGGHPSVGYVDSGLAWERPYPSYLYFGGEMRGPPSPVSINIKRKAGKIFLEAKEVHPNTKVVRVSVGTSSRGWSYEEYPNESYLKPPDKSILFIELSADQARQGFMINVPFDQNIFINTYSLDEYQMSSADFWVWPSSEERLFFSKEENS